MTPVHPRHLSANAWFAFLLIAVTAAVIYGNIWQAPFVFDDMGQIVEKGQIRDVHNYLSLKQILRPRAIVDLTFAMNFKLGGLHVFGYHVVNVLVHIINAFLVYALSLTLYQPKGLSSGQHPFPGVEAPHSEVARLSLVAALVFVAHPVQTQAVTYTVQRYASMAAMFYMASVLCYLRARVIQQRPQHTGSTLLGFGFQVSALYALCILCGLLAFMSKQNTASLPAAILLMECLFIDRTWQGWKKKMPWLGLALVCWVLLVLSVLALSGGEAGGRGVLEDVLELTQETKTVSRWDYLCTQFNVLVIYIRLLFLPIGQNLDYRYPFSNGFFDGATPLALMMLLGIIVLGIWNTKKRPIITMGIFWFFITLSVESSIIPIKDGLFEHRLYLPMFGFSLIAGFLPFHFFPKRRLWAMMLSLAMILSLGTATFLRNRTWQDPIALWADVLSKSPQNARAHCNLGVALVRQGRLGEAVGHLFEALRLKPTYPEALNNLGLALAQQGNLDEATVHYAHALKMKPDYADVHNNLGVLLAEQGRLEEAADHFSEALRIKPGYADAHSNFGLTLARQGRLGEAISHLSRAVRIKPDHAEALFNLGLALARRGNLEEAVDRFTHALRIQPDYAKAHYQLGVALAREDRLDEAMDHFTHALIIEPDNAKAHYNLGIALARRNRLDEAVDHFTHALRIQPDYPKARQSLGRALEARKDGP